MPKPPAEHFVAYHNADQRGFGLEITKLGSWETGKQKLPRPGDVLWGFEGDGNPKKYKLVCRGQVFRRASQRNGKTTVYFRQQEGFREVDVTNLGWFRGLLGAQNNFSYGLNPIKQQATIAALEACSSPQKNQTSTPSGEPTWRIFVGGSDRSNKDYSLLQKIAGTDKITSWGGLKDSQPGDKVLFYVESPVSALCATALVVERAKKGKNWPYEVKVGNFELLPRQIPLSELKVNFPDWGWLQHPGKTTVPTEYLPLLLKLMANPDRSMDKRQTGAGFGISENNMLVESAAIEEVTSRLTRLGYKVQSRESERIGYDLDATKGAETLHIEVKGVSGDEVAFPITAAEVERAKNDPLFRLMVVTGIGRGNRQISEYQGNTVAQRFTMRPISFMAREIA